LSTTTVRRGNSLEIEYERFVRHGRRSELQVRVSTLKPQDREVRVAVSRAYVSALNLEQVMPTPVRVLSSGRSLVYIFENASGSGSIEATFVIEPDELGTHEAEIEVDNGVTVSIRQFTYP
jgi:hypothetical protein